MKILLLSDTHNAHDDLLMSPCDLLIHAGDWSRFGTREEAEAFFAWLGRQPARVRVATAGNHDLFAEQEPEAARALAERNGVTWLIDQGAEVLGLRLWASPFTPQHGKWAFQAERGAPLRERWDRFPTNLDLLITHGPPHGVCDLTERSGHVGCEALLEAVKARPPRVHVFGHVHEGHGEARLDGIDTRFINASSFISTSVRTPQFLGVRPPWIVAW